MCIFIRPVQRVANTRIFIMPLLGGRQLIVYENDVLSTSSSNAMILPVPKTAVDKIEWINMRQHPRFWDNCEDCFPSTGARLGVWATSDRAFTFGGSASVLPVERVGAYNCSFVPAMEDFSRLSTAAFDVPNNIQTVLLANYKEHFSFVVCQFAEQVTGHAIAFICNTMPDGKLFIPTMHAHGAAGSEASDTHHGIICDCCGESPIAKQARWKCNFCPDYDLCNRCYSGAARKTHDEDHLFLHIPHHKPAEQLRPFYKKRDGDSFDHTIYIADALLVAPPTRYSGVKHATKLTPLNDVLQQIDALSFFRIRNLARVEIVGDFPNQDYAAAPYQ